MWTRALERFWTFLQILASCFIVGVILAQATTTDLSPIGLCRRDDVRLQAAFRVPLDNGRSEVVGLIVWPEHGTICLTHAMARSGFLECAVLHP